MKVVILAGGKGTRLSEETKAIPKPLVEIGGQPILEHVMEIYESQGYNDFVIAAGYKSGLIVGHFLSGGYEYERVNGAVFFKDRKRSVAIIPTGEETQTGGRLKRLRPYLSEPFMMTYGDGVGNIQICKVLETFERNQERGGLVTLTAVHPPPRFGSVVMRRDDVTYFGEKTGESNQWINGGFMVIDPKALESITGDETNWEKDVLPIFALAGEVTAYRHEGFWLAMDTLRDKEELEENIKAHGKLWLRKS